MSEHQGCHLSVVLNGAGSHPAAPSRPFTPDAYARLVRGAEAGLLDFVTVEDGPGRLDPALLLGLAAHVTERIGLVPLGPTTGDPAAWATRIATLDHLSAGRAGVRPRATTSNPEHAQLLTVLGTPEGDRRVAELFARAGAFLTEATAAWDSVPSPQGRPPLALLAHATVPYRPPRTAMSFSGPRRTPWGWWPYARRSSRCGRRRAGRPGTCASSPM
ncbi:LLM class flavin-dependent oxidoreductase [Streptomyces sp. NPDC006978]|uniref:LLM class flavin-dependent oxidoreductase n=1 Tax=unclassified Streptomyces TaxID=2593676 RepID=UPI002B0034D1|nr:LLM class flavin-dependent oxidoreductase [Streptomyces sp. S584]